MKKNFKAKKIKKREDYKEELADFIEARRELVWYVKDPRKLDDDAVVEAVLNYGDWDDVQEMIRIMGIENAAAAFYRSSKPDKFQRTNYHPKTTNYFNFYFEKYASGNTN
jgi:hypothetical protein